MPKNYEELIKNLVDDIRNFHQLPPFVEEAIEEISLLLDEMISHQSHYDSLTDLPNRQLFNEKLNFALNKLNQPLEMLAVIFLDLDDFKHINDTLGHAVGDQLLLQVANRLQNYIRFQDCFARWGGDEFIFLLLNINNIDHVSNIAQRMLRCLDQPFEINNRELYIKASIGISVYPFDGQDTETLIKNADAAMYLAKNKGRNNYQVYRPNIGKQANKKLLLNHALYKGLKNHEFLLYYQPQLNLKTNKIFGMEALIRWNHPELGLVSPEQFIPIAEENGLIINIGEWVIKTACEQNVAWQKQGLPPIIIAVNISPRQFQDRHLVTNISTILEETKLDPSYLEIEITESAALEDMNFTVAVLQALKTMGVHISMDDFGTGYSSLWSLKKLPLNKLKIDQSFVKDMMNNPPDIAIITAVINMGHGLNLQVIAEGIETIEQLKFLKSINCDAIQGYYFSKPLPPEEATKLLLNWK
jgi:diguanylate cyclase (GGDEF)-like protein